MRLGPATSNDCGGERVRKARVAENVALEWKHVEPSNLCHSLLNRKDCGISSRVCGCGEEVDIRGIHWVNGLGSEVVLLLNQLTGDSA